MLIAPSVVFVALTFLLITAIAGAICAWMFRLLGDGATPVEPAPATEMPAVAPVPVRAAPQPTGRLVHT
jgi:hypothetical protein